MNATSWGRYPPREAAAVVALDWTSDGLPAGPYPLLPRGLGRSYGDSCLNEGGTLVTTRRLDRVIAFDRTTGVLRAESGISLGEILDLAIPAGWFLPVLPGTRHVTLGGAIANDVHGKNHHRAGSFGNHVRAFELLRSDGSRRECTPGDALFAATVGGLGLTGLVTWAQIALRPVRSTAMSVCTRRFQSLDEFLALSDEASGAHEYVVAWLDCLSRSGPRGHFIAADHVDEDDGSLAKHRPAKRAMAIPFDMPAWALSAATIGAFNAAYFHRVPARGSEARQPYSQFFHPLDALEDWNRLYGARGFVQHQCVVPRQPAREALAAMLSRIRERREGSFLSVLKVLGDVASPGILSFARPGVTLALDFPMRGAPTLALLDELDAIVRDAGGAVYPAKDARMSPQTFRASFPQWESFAAHRDPGFSSSFWRRVIA